MPLFKVEIERTQSVEVYVEAPNAQMIRDCKGFPNEVNDYCCSSDFDDDLIYINGVKEITEIPKGFGIDFTIDSYGELREG